MYTRGCFTWEGLGSNYFMEIPKTNGGIGVPHEIWSSVSLSTKVASVRHVVRSKDLRCYLLEDFPLWDSVPKLFILVESCNKGKHLKRKFVRPIKMSDYRNKIIFEKGIAYLLQVFLWLVFLDSFFIFQNNLSVIMEIRSGSEFSQKCWVHEDLHNFSENIEYFKS